MDASRSFSNCIPRILKQNQKAMRNYDDWKTSTPEEEDPHECPECGGYTYEENTYCSRECFLASMI